VGSSLFSKNTIRTSSSQPVSSPRSRPRRQDPGAGRTVQRGCGADGQLPTAAARPSEV
jgi:hypothetical protein